MPTTPPEEDDELELLLEELLELDELELELVLEEPVLDELELDELLELLELLELDELVPSSSPPHAVNNASASAMGTSLRIWNFPLPGFFIAIDFLSFGLSESS